MVIHYKVTQLSIETILNQFRQRKLRKPAHQRNHRWDKKRQQLLIETIRRRLPIPSLTIYKDSHGTYWIEDGVQRIYTIRRFVDDEDDENLFGLLSEDDKKNFLEYKVPVLIYENATNEERIEIFDRLQNGLVLSTGERLNSLRFLSPIVDYSCKLLLYPDADYKTRFQPFWGERIFDVSEEENKKSSSKRFLLLTQSVVLISGILFGPEYITENYEKIRERLRLPLTSDMKTNIKNTLDNLFKVYEKALSTYIHEDDIKIKNKTLQNALWKPSNFSSYILYSFDQYPSLIPDLIDFWSKFVVEYRKDTCILKSKLLEPVKLYKGKTKLCKGFENILSGTLKQKVELVKAQLQNNNGDLHESSDEDTFSIEDE